jgi:hypothetical protein
VSITAPGGTPQTTKPFIDSARNFTGPQIYRVTSEDGSCKDYAVSVHLSGGGAKLITGFVFNSVPVGGGKTVQAVGQINQDTLTIEVRVPHSAVITGLAPTITYLGASLGYGTISGSPSPVNENTGSVG